MIKIIGNDPRVARQATCKNCGTILEFVPADVTQHHHTDYTGCRETVNRIVCPVCTKAVPV